MTASREYVQEQLIKIKNINEIYLSLDVIELKQILNEIPNLEIAVILELQHMSRNQNDEVLTQIIELKNQIKQEISKTEINIHKLIVEIGIIPRN